MLAAPVSTGESNIVTNEDLKVFVSFVSHFLPFFPHRNWYVSLKAPTAKRKEDYINSISRFLALLGLSSKTYMLLPS